MQTVQVVHVPTWGPLALHVRSLHAPTPRQAGADADTRCHNPQVNYCFVTFDNWRSAQRACNQSERNIMGQARARTCLLLPAARSTAQHAALATIAALHALCVASVQRAFLSDGLHVLLIIYVGHVWRDAA